MTQGLKLRALMIVPAALSLLAACSSASAQDERLIPEDWRGVWAENLSDCSVREELATFSVGADRIDFYESGGRVRGAFLRGPFELMVVLEMSGEGHTWMTSMHFTAASDFQYIQTVPDDPDAGKLTLYRCPVGD